MDDDCIIHNLNGPAVIKDNGRRKEWWVNGILHRENAPAIIVKSSDGSFLQEWWVNGKKHRTDGPAVIKYQIKRVDYNNKNKVKKIKVEEWWVNGKKYNKDGPAVQKTSMCIDTRWYKDDTEMVDNNEQRDSYISIINNNTNNLIIEKLFSNNNDIHYY